MNSPRPRKRRRLSGPDDSLPEASEPPASSSSAKDTWNRLKARSEAEKRDKLRRKKGTRLENSDENNGRGTGGENSRKIEPPEIVNKSPPGVGFFKKFTRQKLEENDGDAASGVGEDLRNGIHVAQPLSAKASKDVHPDTPVRASARSRRPTAKVAETQLNAKEIHAHRETLERHVSTIEMAAHRDRDESVVTSSTGLKNRERKKTTRDSSGLIKSQRKSKGTKQDAGHSQNSKETLSIPRHVVERELSALDVQTTHANSESDKPPLVNMDCVSIPSKNPSASEIRSAASPVSSIVMDEPTFESEQLQAIHNIISETVAGHRPFKLMHLEDEYAKVATMLSQTVAAGESNSMLIIGARGTGKTALVDQILREQTIEHPNDFLVVRLNGFIHTDDKIALRDIWRQLGREMDLNEVESTTKNYADTLTSLLALLSHPAETGQEQQPGQTSKSVIFILDEFDLFASHPRQTLLYNLFDIAQSRKAPIAVLGLTTKVDVAESLEKRVKSRFSHRYVHLSSSKSYPAFLSACQSALTLRDGNSSLERSSDTNDSFSDSKQSGSLKETPRVTADSVKQWNKHVLAQLESAEAYDKHLHRIYYTSKSIPEFLSSMLAPLAALPCTQPLRPSAIVSHLVSAFSSSAAHPDSKLNLLSSLSTLQLALLICACRLNAIHGTETITFALTYEEYRSIASKAKVQATASGSSASPRISSKDVARLAWNELLETGLVMESDGRKGEGSGRVDVALEEIGAAGIDLGDWGRWCRQI
nr:origin recognition complex subunit 4 [Quercus suber]